MDAIYSMVKKQIQPSPQLCVPGYRGILVVKTKRGHTIPDKSAPRHFPNGGDFKKRSKQNKSHVHVGGMHPIFNSVCARALSGEVVAKKLGHMLP